MIGILGFVRNDGSAWKKLMKGRATDAVLNIDPLFALPTNLIRAIEKHDSDFWTEEESRFENNLAVTSGGVFINRLLAAGQPRRPFLLECDFLSDCQSDEILEMNNLFKNTGEEIRNDATKELGLAGVPPGDITEMWTTEEEFRTGVANTRLAYAGWLTLNKTFLEELQSLRDQSPSTIGPEGRFPVLQGNYSQGDYETWGKLWRGNWTPSDRKERKFDKKCQAFFERWCIQALFNWDIPIPLGTLGLLDSQPQSCGVHIFLPWYAFKKRELKIPEYLYSQAVQQQASPLASWLKKGGQGLVYYERLFRMFVYFGLAICRRYADRISKRPTRLDRAFMEYFGIDPGKDSLDLISKMRQKLNKTRHLYGK
jgi:hypothetical protein